MASASKSLYAPASSKYPYTLTVDTWDNGNVNVANNTSQVYAKATLYGKNIGFDLNNVQNYLKLKLWDNNEHSGGVEIASKQVSTLNKGNSVSVEAWYTVKHRDDGSLNVSVSAIWQKASGNYAPASGDVGSGTYSSQTIARASQPSCITYPNTTTNVGKMGDNITIHMNRASGSFTHTVKYTFGSTSETIATGVTDDCSWTIPKTLANQITSATSGTGGITVDTYNGGTHIGTKSVSFNVNISDDTKPSISALAIAETVSGLASKFGAYVQNKSKPKFTTTAAGIYGSTISNYTIKVNGSQVYSGTANNFTMTNALPNTSNSYEVTVKDSRGRTATKTGTISATAYSAPSSTIVSAVRNSTTKTTVDVKFNGSIAAVGNKNDKKFTIQYKVKGASAWTNFGTVYTGAYSYSNQTLAITGLAVANSYEIRVLAHDYFGDVGSTIVTVGTEDVVINIRADKKGIGLGKYNETQNTIDTSWAVKSSSNVTGVHTIGTTSVRIPKNGSAGAGLCNSDGASIIRDHTNKNVTVDATGGTLFLGYQNTTGINFMNSKASMDSNGYLNTGRGNGTGWKNLYNNTSGTTGTITLSETAANFTWLDIYVAEGPMFRVYSPNNKSLSIDCVSSDQSSSSNVGYILNYKYIKISGTSITNTYTNRMYMYPSLSKPAQDKNNYITIVRVDGWKG